jgi:hypothetical protein
MATGAAIGFSLPALSFRSSVGIVACVIYVGVISVYLHPGYARINLIIVNLL